MSLRINDNGTDREMTLAEQTQFEAWATAAQNEQAANAQLAADKAAARASALAKLAALGLTDDEITAIVG